ncbi:methyltransferase, TIGR04325 family [Paraburkholderia acidisoli]|uniref:Methyltransferase, TIGR04325 family n=1 Tax=Paraburkholderia acidisoli TaxID=2571748 RepID=A0A7Z2GFC6_9BURK|nr:methyltransferase, TIGR04325 family [Paraburkholderia acidisoli]QGZ60776.1 methyltransferase, TIGR04325 family [Paraburkholderia acidisoli]
MKNVLKAMFMHSQVGSWVGKIPGVPQFYARTVWSKRMNPFFGLYGSFEDAERAATDLNHVGWNDEGIARVLVHEETHEAPQPFQTSQFAVLLWLSKLLKSGSTVLDIGGAGGIFYEICTRYDLLSMPLRWHVVDMPETVKRGIARHEELKSTMITFGTDLAEAPMSSIMLMLGVIQYLPDPLGEKGPGVLESVETLPSHIFVNKVSLTDDGEIWTIQNYITTATPYRFFSRKKFMAYFESHGYRLRDRWLVPEISVSIPFHPERTLSCLEGFYFERQPEAQTQ